MKKVFTLMAMMLTFALSSFAQDTWTIAGSAAIVNGDKGWDPTNTANDMVLQADGLTYILVVENCGLEAGQTYEYKVAKDHGWGESWPANNAILTVDETALYTITYTYDSELFELDHEVTKTGTYVPGEKTYTVAGVSALCGSEWDPTDTSNDLVKQADGTYVKVYQGKDLAKGRVEFKIVVDHAWGNGEYPSSNYQLQIPEDGKYDVTITTDPSTKKIEAEAVKTSDVVIEHTWTIAGGVAGANEGETTLFGSFWDANNSVNDMVEQPDGTWLLVKENVALEAVTYAFKACRDHAWDVSYGDPEAADGNAQLEIATAGNYHVYFTLDLTEGEEKVSAEAQFLGGDSTGIDEVNNGQPATVYYNLQGIRSDKMERGLYITNGRKVVVK